MGFLRENKSSTIIETVMWITEEDIVQGYDIKGVFICDKDIGELIARLRENGVKIDLARSEKKISYNILDGETRESCVPLNSSFENNVGITEYKLRTGGENLEIMLKDCDESSLHHPGRIGCAVSRRVEVYCDIKFKGRYKEGAIVEKVAEILSDFYKQPNRFEKYLMPHLKDVKK